MDKGEELNGTQARPQEVLTTPRKRTRWLRELTSRSVLTFTIAAAFCLMMQMSLAVVILTQVTFLEREFGFSSSQSGRLMSAGEIGFMCVAIPASYLATRVHVPRAFSLACFLVGVTGIMCGLPHFIFGSTEHHANSTTKSAASMPPAYCAAHNATWENQRCLQTTSASMSAANVTEETVSEELVYNANAYRVFVYIMVFMVLRGVVGSPRFAMFAVYIEQNTVKTDSGFYMGIMAAVTMLGPAIAFIGGGAMSKLHVSLKATDLTPDHPDWVGAWWLGFLLFGTLAAVTPLVIFSFPRRLPGAPASRVVSLYGRTPKGDGMLQDVVNELKMFVVTLLELLTNPILLLVIVASCCMAFSMNGTYRFLPKYLQEQFQLPAYKANFIMGGAELLVGTSGFFLGGWLTRRLKLRLIGLVKLAIAILGLSVACLVIQMLIGCPQPTLMGAPGSDLSGMPEFGHCVSNCSCPDEVLPVCSNGVNYFSPCHAGCVSQIDGVYMNCSCTESGSATPGLCDSACTAIYGFSVVFYLLLFLLSVGGAPMYLVLMRSVADYHAGLAMGFNGFCASLVGFLIGPVVYGGLIDTVCEHWRSPCGVEGSCAVYNLERFRVTMHLYTIVSLSLSVVCYVIAFLLLRFCKGLKQNKVEETADESVDKNVKDAVDTGSTPLVRKYSVEKRDTDETSANRNCADVDNQRVTHKTRDEEEKGNCELIPLAAESRLCKTLT